MAQARYEVSKLELSEQWRAKIGYSQAKER